MKYLFPLLTVFCVTCTKLYATEQADLNFLEIKINLATEQYIKAQTNYDEFILNDMGDYPNVKDKESFDKKAVNIREWRDYSEAMLKGYLREQDLLSKKRAGLLMVTVDFDFQGGSLTEFADYLEKVIPAASYKNSLDYFTQLITQSNKKFLPVGLDGKEIKPTKKEQEREISDMAKQYSIGSFSTVIDPSIANCEIPKFSVNSANFHHIARVLRLITHNEVNLDINPDTLVFATLPVELISESFNINDIPSNKYANLNILMHKTFEDSIPKPRIIYSENIMIVHAIEKQIQLIDRLLGAFRSNLTAQKTAN